jgi:hypothetical protein
MVEADLLAFVSNQGLAVAVSIFLIWWVTSEVSKSLEKIASFLNDHDRRADDRGKITLVACQKVDAIYEKVMKE